MNTIRRHFVIQCSSGLLTASLAPLAIAMAGPVTDEKDPKALALGYKADASKIDAAQHPKYAAGQSCGSCTSFQGKPGIAAGPCPQMPKPVLTAGWCSAYNKKS
jgi:High potential iron-sulfur protein